MDEIPFRTELISKTETNFRFVGVSAKQINKFLEQSPRYPKSILVWMLILNACRACKSNKIELTRKWRMGINISNNCLNRSLKQLATAGFIDVTFKKGKSPTVKLIDPSDCLL